jgi:hypothetical protein
MLSWEARHLNDSRTPSCKVNEAEQQFVARAVVGKFVPLFMRTFGKIICVTFIYFL